MGKIRGTQRPLKVCISLEECGKICRIDVMKNCKECAKKLIDEMNDEDVATVLPLLEHIDSLRQTIEVLDDPEAMAALAESEKAVKQGKVKALAEL